MSRILLKALTFLRQSIYVTIGAASSTLETIERRGQVARGHSELDAVLNVRSV